MATVVTSTGPVVTPYPPMDLTNVPDHVDKLLLTVVLTKYCGVPDDASYHNSNIVKALRSAGITGFFQLTALKDEAFSQLEYQATDSITGNVEWFPVTIAEASSLHVLKAGWHQRSHELGLRADPTHPDHFNKKWYDNFRIDHYDGNAKVTPWTHRNDTNEALKVWKKITKPSSKDIPKLVESVSWFRYRENMSIALQAGGLSHLIDPKYVPPPGDVALFEAQMNWLYKALIDNVANGTGLRILREHLVDKDTRVIWSEFEKHFGSSIACQIRKQSLATYLMCDCKFTTINWKGKIIEYLAHFNEKAREYQELAEKGEEFTDSQLVNMLNNAVTGVPGLQEVLNHHRVAAKAASRTLASNGTLVSSNVMSYDELLEALMHQAQIIDQAQSGNKKFFAQRHSLSVYGLDESDDDDDEDEGDGISANVHNINTPIEQLVNRGGTRHRGARGNTKCFNLRLKSSDWDNMPVNDRKLWAQMSDEGRKALIAAKEPEEPRNKMEAKIHETVDEPSTEEPTEETKKESAGNIEVTVHDTKKGGSTNDLLALATQKNTSKQAIIAANSHIAKVLATPGSDAVVAVPTRSINIHEAFLPRSSETPELEEDLLTGTPVLEINMADSNGRGLGDPNDMRVFERISSLVNVPEEEEQIVDILPSPRSTRSGRRRAGMSVGSSRTSVRGNTTSVGSARPRRLATSAGSARSDRVHVHNNQETGGRFAGRARKTHQGSPLPDRIHSSTTTTQHANEQEDKRRAQALIRKDCEQKFEVSTDAQGAATFGTSNHTNAFFGNSAERERAGRYSQGSLAHMRTTHPSLPGFRTRKQTEGQPPFPDETTSGVDQHSQETAIDDVEPEKELGDPNDPRFWERLSNMTSVPDNVTSSENAEEPTAQEGTQFMDDGHSSLGDGSAQEEVYHNELYDDDGHPIAPGKNGWYPDGATLEEVIQTLIEEESVDEELALEMIRNHEFDPKDSIQFEAIYGPEYDQMSYFRYRQMYGRFPQTHRCMQCTRVFDGSNSATTPSASCPECNLTLCLRCVRRLELDSERMVFICPTKRCSGPGWNQNNPERAPEDFKETTLTQLERARATNHSQHYGLPIKEEGSVQQERRERNTKPGMKPSSQDKGGAIKSASHVESVRQQRLPTIPLTQGRTDTEIQEEESKKFRNRKSVHPHIMDPRARVMDDRKKHNQRKNLPKKAAEKEGTGLERNDDASNSVTQSQYEPEHTTDMNTTLQVTGPRTTIQHLMSLPDYEPKADGGELQYFLDRGVVKINGTLYVITKIGTAVHIPDENNAEAEQTVATEMETTSSPSDEISPSNGETRPASTETKKQVDMKPHAVGPPENMKFDAAKPTAKTRTDLTSGQQGTHVEKTTVARTNSTSSKSERTKKQLEIDMNPDRITPSSLKRTSSSRSSKPKGENKTTNVKSKSRKPLPRPPNPNHNRNTYAVLRDSDSSLDVEQGLTSTQPVESNDQGANESSSNSQGQDFPGAKDA